jgi:P-loop ATPase protein family
VTALAAAPPPCPYCPPGAAPVPMALVVSFGFLHDGPPGYGEHRDPGEAGEREELPRADVVADLREHFRDPHAVDGLRELTADDPRVTAAVLATPGVTTVISGLCVTARGYLAGGRPVTIAVGCAGGRHRSAAVAAAVARQLQADGVPAAVVHRDITRPVAHRAPGRPS